MMKMKYRKLGKTGLEVSILGYGCMRLPTLQPGISVINEKKAIELIRHSIDNGVNYMDSAYLYHNGKSEFVLGKALKDGYRDEVFIETKLLLPEVKESKDYRRLLNVQCKKLGVNKIDVYLFHGLSWNRYQNIALKLKLIEQAQQAKKEGKIGHIGFSSHDTPENIKRLIDTGFFEVMLVQYNILDPTNHDIIAYAGKKGLGVNIMGPNGGGRLSLPPPASHTNLLSPNRKNLVDVALNFVWSHPHVSCALSGMNTKQMIDDNIFLASDHRPYYLGPLSERVESIRDLYKRSSEVPCTGCGYCLPCPQNVNIPFIFKQLFQSSTDAISWEYAKIYYTMLNKTHSDLVKEFPDENWGEIGLNPEKVGNNTTACKECGLCEEKCPQNIPIRNKLKYAHGLLTKFVSYNQ